MFEYMDSDSFEVEKKASFLKSDITDLMWAIDQLWEEAEGEDLEELASVLEELGQMALEMQNKLKKVL